MKIIDDSDTVHSQEYNPAAKSQANNNNSIRITYC